MSTDAEPLCPHLGIRLHGLDLGSDGPRAAERVRDALWTHHVVAVPAQRLDEAALLDVSRRLGPLEAHVLSQYHHPRHPEILMLSNVEEGGKPLGLADAGSYWHSDISYKACPSRATVLYAIEVPEAGGDTLFANMVAAWEALPDDLRRALEGRRAIHEYAQRSDGLAHGAGVRAPLTPAQRAATPPVSHPAVRVIPETGQRAVYVNPGFTVALEGLPAEESRYVLERVFAHCLEERFGLRYRWQPGDLLIWDNAAVMHAATAMELPAGARRTLWRTIISGDTPVGA